MAKGLRNAEAAFPTIDSFYILCKARSDDIRPYNGVMLRFVGAHIVRPSIHELIFERAELAPTWLMAKGLRNAETAFPTIGSFCILCKARADDIRPYMANG